MTKRKKDQKNQRRNFEESERFKNNKEIVNEDIEKTAKSVKSPEEAVINMENSLKVTNVTHYGFPTNNAKYLKNSKQIKVLLIWSKNLRLVNPSYYSKYQL